MSSVKLLSGFQVLRTEKRLCSAVMIKCILTTTRKRPLNVRNHSNSTLPVPGIVPSSAPEINYEMSSHELGETRMRQSNSRKSMLPDIFLPMTRHYSEAGSHLQPVFWNIICFISWGSERHDILPVIAVILVLMILIPNKDKT